MKWVLLIAALGLMILGLTEIIKQLILWGTEPKKPMHFIWIIMPETADSCEFLIRSAAERMRWLGLENEGKLLCISEDEETQAISNRLIKEFPYLTVSNSRDLGYNTVKAVLNGLDNPNYY